MLLPVGTREKDVRIISNFSSESPFFFFFTRICTIISYSRSQQCSIEIRPQQRNFCINTQETHLICHFSQRDSRENSHTSLFIRLEMSENFIYRLVTCQNTKTRNSMCDRITDIQHLNTPRRIDRQETVENEIESQT